MQGLGRGAFASTNAQINMHPMPMGMWDIWCINTDELKLEDRHVMEFEML